jgi:hypothetical protein
MAYAYWCGETANLNKRAPGRSEPGGWHGRGCSGGHVAMLDDVRPLATEAFVNKFGMSAAPLSDQPQ